MTVTLMRVQHETVGVLAETHHEAAQIAAAAHKIHDFEVIQVESCESIQLVDGVCHKCGKHIFQGEASIKDIDQLLCCGHCFVDWSDVVQPDVPPEIPSAEISNVEGES
ncbi:MAG: hypothetical protein V4719_10670 [Planctomycetota bacterium]